MPKLFSQKIRFTSIHRIYSQIRKELDWFIHDRLSVGILFFLPLFVISLIGGGALTIGEITGTPTVYFLDLDGSDYSIAYIESYRQSEYFNMDVYDNWNNPDIVTLENCESSIITDTLDGYVIIPSNYSEDLLENRSSYIDIYLDSRSDAAGLLTSYFNSGNIVYQSEYQIFNGEIVYVPDFRPTDEFSFIQFVLPILIPLLLFVCANLIASQSIIGDEPLKRILLTPAKKIEIVLAKSVAYTLLGILLSFLTILILQVVFNIEFYSFWNTFVITAMIPTFGVVYGILFSSFTTTKLQAAQLSLFAFIFQFTIVMFLRINPIVQYFPVDIIRRLFMLVAFRGISLSAILDEFAFMFMHMAIVLLSSVWFYSRKKFSS